MLLAAVAALRMTVGGAWRRMTVGGAANSERDTCRQEGRTSERRKVSERPKIKHGGCLRLFISRMSVGARFPAVHIVLHLNQSTLLFVRVLHIRSSPSRATTRSLQQVQDMFLSTNVFIERIDGAVLKKEAHFEDT